MELFLSILGIGISVVIAYWEHRKAKRAEAHLEALATKLPETLLSGVRKVLSDQALEGGANSDGWSLPGTKAEQSPWLRTRYADIDSDGTDELLIEVTAGAHSSALLVYAVKNWEFKKLAELNSTTMNGFDVQDSDGDGRLEVETVEVAKRPGLPHVFGLRDRVTHRLVGNKFEEVSRTEGWDQSDLDRISAESQRAVVDSGA